MASRAGGSEQVRPTDCATKDWTVALLEDRVRARTFDGAVSIAVARLLTEATSEGAVHPRRKIWSHAQDARDAAVATEVGLPKRTLTSLRLGSQRPQSAQVDLILASPTYGFRLVALIMDGLNHLADPLSEPKSSNLRRRGEVYLVHHRQVVFPATRPRRLTPEQRRRLELVVLHGVASLATDRPVQALPQSGGWEHPEHVRWDLIATQIGPGLIKPSHVYRDMVRGVVPDNGEPISNSDIQRLIKERYGPDAPDPRTINLAIGGLRRMGELASVGYGKQQATEQFRRPKRSTNPHGLGRILRGLGLPHELPPPHSGSGED